MFTFARFGFVEHFLLEATFFCLLDIVEILGSFDFVETFFVALSSLFILNKSAFDYFQKFWQLAFFAVC